MVVMPEPYSLAVDADLRRRVERLDAVCFDFDGVFTDNTVWVRQDGVESVRCWRGDGLGLAQLRGLGLRTLIVSTEKNPVVQVRARKLEIECLHGIDDKAVALAGWCARTGISPDRMAFVGNDVNDLPALLEVGLPIGVADAHHALTPVVRYRTQARGGFGAVREVCDLIAAVRSTARAEE